MLRLVHPAPGGQGTDPPARRKGGKNPSLYLTADEKRHLRASMRNIARAYGGLDVLALVIGTTAESIYSMMRPRCALSGTVAIRVAKAGGVSVESVLTGAINDASRCPTCGHKPGSGRLAAGGAS